VLKDSAVQAEWELASISLLLTIIYFQIITHFINIRDHITVSFDAVESTSLHILRTDYQFGSPLYEKEE
jgi:hypothetical protein